MNAEETLRLIEAGFSADEIRKMAEEGTKDPETKTEPEGKTEPEREGAEGEPVNASKEIEALTAEVSKLTDTVKMLQEANIKNAGTGSAKSPAADPVNEAINNFLKEL